MSIIQDISKLTTIPEKALNKLVTKAIWCICDNIENDQLSNINCSNIDIGLGNLVISDSDDEIKYKFIPSEKLDSAVKETLVNHKNPLTLILEKTLVNMITKTYKDII